MAHVLLHCINTSIKSSEITNELLTNLLTPIPKIVNTCKASEFRPINSLPCVEKILESVVYA
ncbi:hypothetical protein HHI36_011377, partial [Cryptolaemus montrouzieri]